jgi:lipopolysaccharide assembly protein A
VRILTWAIRLAVFVLLVAFAAKNVAPVKLQFYFDLALEAPLVLVLLGAFALGALLGVLAMVSTVLRQRRQISILQRAPQPAPPAPPPPF